MDSELTLTPAITGDVPDTDRRTLPPLATPPPLTTPGPRSVLVAVYGSGDLVCAMAWVGIAHSLFEIWLLPRSLSQVRTVAGLVFAVHAGDVQSQGGLRGQPCKVAKLKPCKVVNKIPQWLYNYAVP